ncbi:MAG TPA: hypothetical protein VFW76_14030 [Ktedonobacterales bacterium]|nr:hypothetical protein [Ktedonobacterales bacterium]
MAEVSDTPGMPGTPAMTGMARIGFAPIVRVDAPRREIELCATSETVDSHGTIFDYNASKDAFTRWIGNVREMHGRQAVGSRVAVRCDDETRRVYVRIRISRGARDTWEKVLDGTLRGASIGASDVVWQRQRRRVAGEQRSLNVATRYDLVELSLVDNPSNPDALGVTFVRDATPDVALLDVLDEPATEADEPGDSDGPTVADARTPEQANRARLHGAAQAVLTGCGCSVCVAARALLADVRLPIERGADVQADEQPLARALAAGLADNAIQIVALDAGVRALAATIEASLHQMAGEVGGLSRRVVALENQPLAGGPVARPVDKSSALTARGQMGTPAAREKYLALESLGGEVRDPQVQVAIAAELIRLRQHGEG